MMRAPLVRSHQRRGQKVPTVRSITRCRSFCCRSPNLPWTRWVILLSGLIVIGSLVGCDVSPQSLGITGPGNQQKPPGGQYGAGAQHTVPYTGVFVDSQEG
jgi:hypothetical protein